LDAFGAGLEVELSVKTGKIPILDGEEWVLSAALDDYYAQQRKKKKKKVKREIQRLNRVNAGGNK